MKKFKQILSMVLVIAMLCGMVVFPVSAEETITPITGGETISADGIYQLAADATGTITVAAGVTEATIIGNGAEWDEDPTSATHGAISSTPNSNLLIDCTAAEGVELTIRDAYISNSGVTHNLVDFLGTGNTLIFDGTVIMDFDNGAGGYASIHVPTGSDLTIYGTTGSRAYLYKSEQAAGIGGNYYEACGEITFGLEGGENDFWFFMKGSKQGAVIGNGANCADVPGNITFNSGIYNMLGVARGAIISGSAGADSEGAGNVFVNGGLINMNVDFSGAAIGGGGYAEGNDKSGGLLYVSGGSIRTYIDSNAVSSWSSYGVTQCGVNDAAITAGRVNANGNDVYLLTVDTTGAEAESYTIAVDGEVFYEGPRYAYSYYMEDQNRDIDGDGSADLATAPAGTPGNWVVMDEPCFYLYVTGEDHTISVNGEDTTYTWDAETKSFTVASDTEEPTEEPTEETTEAPHEHSYEAVVTVPTCTEGGHTTYTCECGDTYTADETAALGHTYENGTCTVCGQADPDYVETREVVVSGSCGSALTYTVYDNGDGTHALVIAGTGTMTTMYRNGTPWSEYLTTITSVSMPEGMTSISQWAFSGMTALTELTIPASVTTIGAAAFYQCTALTEVTIPATVTTWSGDSFFSSCTSLVTATLEEGCTTVPRWMFGNCSALTTVYLPSTLTAINDSVFANCSALETVYFNGTTGKWFGVTVGNNNAPLSSANVICTDSDSIVVVDFSVTDGTNTLSAATVQVFDGEGNEVTGGGNKFALIPGASYTYTVICADYITVNGTIESAEAGTISVVMEMDMTPTVVASGNCGYDANSDYAADDNLTYEIIKTGTNYELVIEGEGAMYEYLSNDLAPWYNYPICTVTISEGVTTIGRYAFYNCSSITTVDVPNTINAIGWAAFEMCSSLTSIVVPEGVTTIGANTFKNCYALATMYLPKSLTYIASQASWSCPLTAVYYAGTPADWANITIDSFWNDPLINAAINGTLITNTYALNFTVNVEDAAIVVMSQGEEVAPYNGVYYIYADQEATYTVTADGYVPVSETVSYAQSTEVVAIEVNMTAFPAGDYTVNMAEAVNGTVKVAAAERANGTASEGDTVTITATPTPGYQLTSITVTDAEGNAVVVSGNTFVMPASDVTVSVVFEETWYHLGVLDTYTISTADELREFAAIVNGTYEGLEADTFEGKTVTLTADIDLSGEQWTPVGTGDHPFYGTFDGYGYTISGLIMNGEVPASGDAVGYYAALFGYVKNAAIQNLTVEGTITSYYTITAGIVAEGSGTISDCTNKVAINYIVDNQNAVGGVAGIFNGTISDCFNNADLTAYASEVAGIAGQMMGTVQNCANYGAITNYGTQVAGIVAQLNSDGSVIGCANQGAVTNDNQNYSTTTTAGIVAKAGSSSVIIDCYNAADVTSNGDAGNQSSSGSNECAAAGIMASFGGTGITIDNCYNVGTITKADMHGARYGEIAPSKDWGGSGYGVYYTVDITEDQVKVTNCYTKAELEALYNAVVSLNKGGDSWNADTNSINNGYPILSWQGGTPVTSYAWYEAGTESGSYTISTAEELAQFAAIVNGTDENYAQDNFDRKTVSLANDIALAEDGLYIATENVTYGSASWPMTTTQYVLAEEAPVWTPIGSGSASGNTVSSTANSFAGTFDGQGYTISGVYTGSKDASTANTATVQGLFGIVTGTVKNVTVSGCITGNSVVGGVVAYLNGGTVENCVNNAIVFADGGTTPNGNTENGTSRAGATGGIVGLAAGTGSVTGCSNNATVICANTAKGGRVGGIVGLIDQSGDAISISKCVNNGAVEGYQYVAGICGMNYAKNSPIDRCVNHGNITMHGGGKAHAGGIAGQFDCQITNCYNTGNIHATHTTSQEPRYFGGIAGDYNYSTGNGKIINCYTTGTVTYDFGSARDTGIIVGESGYAVNSYFLDTALTGSGSAVNQFDGISKTDAELKAANMVGLLGDAFHVDTDSINNGYPVLDWQGGSVYVPRAPYIITTAEELLMLAQEVNAGETKLGETYTLGNDIDLSTVCSADLGSWNAIGGAAEKIILDINSQEELDAMLEQYNIIYDDTGWSYKYGTDKNLPYDENRTYYAVVGKIFSGTFDGAGYTISNLYVLSETGYAGLFGNVDGTLKNFTVTGSVTTATGSTEVDFVGGVTGKLSEGGRIERVVSYVNVDASAKAYNVGGIAGFCGTKNATADNAFSSAENTVIVECVNYGSVYGWSQVGGIAGENAGQILRCANYGDVDALKSGSKAGIGGIAGRNGCNNVAYTKGTIIDCYNFGTIATSDNKWVGGIAGFNNAESIVRNCYNAGTVQGAGQANALVGQNEGSGDNGVYNCWYLESTKVFDESGVYGGKYANCGPKTEAEMKAPVFAAILGSSFNVDSDLINEGYPVLKWQGGSEAPAIYTVTIPANGEGYTVAIADGCATTVVEGGEFKFSVYLLEGYEIVSVKAGETELTAVNGVYTIENIQSDVTVTIEVQALPAYTLGDVNGDGVIDNTDAMLVMQYAVGDEVEGLDLEACDVNGDGVINNEDAMLIMQFVVGSISAFPAQP